MGHTLLFVDDEPNILSALKRVFFSDDYEILTANSGAEAIELFKAKEVSLIITDYKMPGMSGIELLEQVTALTPRSVRFVLTGYADITATIDAINRGHVHRYFLKPWQDQELRSAVAHHLEELELRDQVERLHRRTVQQNQNLRALNDQLAERASEIKKQNEKLQQANEQLKSSFNGLATVLSNTIKLYDQSLGSHGVRVAVHAKRLGEKLGLDEAYCEQIYVAGLLHDIGLIGVPQAVIKKCNKKLVLDNGEREQYEQHPVLGEKLTHINAGFERVSKLIRMHHEHYDGSGYPDRLTSFQILPGAQVIAVADKYDDIVCRNGDRPDIRLHQEAIRYLRESRHRLYDPDVVDLFLELLDGELARSLTERPVPVQDLEAGLVLSRHIYATSGLMMLASGVKLDKELVLRLKQSQELAAADLVVYVHTSEATDGARSINLEGAAR